MLGCVAVSLMATLASEAACERMFNQQALAHTFRRHAMKDDLVEAEVMIRCLGRNELFTKRDRLGGTVKPIDVDEAPLSDHVTVEVAKTIQKLAAMKQRFEVLQAGHLVRFTEEGAAERRGKVKQVQRVWPHGFTVRVDHEDKWISLGAIDFAIVQNP
jgi:hypothetical protein